MSAVGQQLAAAPVAPAAHPAESTPALPAPAVLAPAPVVGSPAAVPEHSLSIQHTLCYPTRFEQGWQWVGKEGPLICCRVLPVGHGAGRGQQGHVCLRGCPSRGHRGQARELYHGGLRG